jgi:hypothetical protein
MILFDEFEELTIEEQIVQWWNTRAPATQAAWLAEAEAQQCTWWDLALEAIQECLDQWEDPIEAPKLRAEMAHKRHPFGVDPRLRKAGAP